MSAAERRRVPALRIVAIVLGGILLLGLSTVLYIRHGIDRRWDAMESRIRELHSKIAVQGLNRPVLRGQPAPGDARADYEAVGALCAKLNYRYVWVMEGYLRRPSTTDPDGVSSLLTRGSPILEAMRRGAGRASFVRLDESRGNPVFLQAREALEVMIPLVLVQARILRESGRLREAAELLLDALRYQGDYVIPDQPFSELEELLRSKELPVEIAGALHQGLEILDGSFPSQTEALDRNLFLLGTALLRSRGGATDALERFGISAPDTGWRYCFSSRLVEVEAFETIDRLFSEIRNWQSLPWQESLHRQESLRERSIADANDIVQQYRFESLTTDLLYRGHRAHLRMLLVAARYRATGQVPDLEDPFGGRLKTEKTDRGLRISSKGDEGKESFQQLSFDQNPNGELETIRLALEVPR